MSSVYKSSEFSEIANPAINIDPRFIVWKTNDPNITATSALPAWKISALSGAYVSVLKNSNLGGLSITATNNGSVEISQKLTLEDYISLSGRTVTLSLKLSSPTIAIKSMGLVYNSTTNDIKTMALKTPLPDFYSVSIPVKILDSATVNNFSIKVVIDSPGAISFQYIKLEIGGVPSKCPIRNLIDEINLVDSRYNGKIVGTFGRSRYRTDITNTTVDLNSYNLANGEPEVFSAIVKTDVGAANISNMPVTYCAFAFDVELIRWISQNDYVSRQTLIPSNTDIVYARYCKNGTYTSWTPIGKSDSIIELNKNDNLSFWVGTYAEYKLIPSANINPLRTYIITDDPPTGVYPEFDYYTKTDTFIEVNKRKDFQIWIGTDAEFEAIPVENRKNNILYIVGAPL